jgi:hypothetical protein
MEESASLSSSGLLNTGFADSFTVLAHTFPAFAYELWLLASTKCSVAAPCSFASVLHRYCNTDHHVRQVPGTSGQGFFTTILALAHCAWHWVSPLSSKADARKKATDPNVLTATSVERATSGILLRGLPQHLVRSSLSNPQVLPERQQAALILQAQWS